MFKIIKTSTYKKMKSDYSNLMDYAIRQKEEIKNLKEQLSHLTAKKLPIKKSKKC